MTNVGARLTNFGTQGIVIILSFLCDKRLSIFFFRILKYTTQHAHDDALVVGVPQSENPFKDAKGCLIL